MPSAAWTLQVFQDPARRRSLYWMLGSVAVLFALYLAAVRYFRSRHGLQDSQS